MFAGETFRSESVNGLSGVSAQPMSDQETLRGALNRAQSARNISPSPDFAVGLEAGCKWIAGSPYLFAWVVVIAGDQMGRARTATLPLPSGVSDLIAQKVELGEANDRVFGRVDSKRNSGSVGISPPLLRALGKEQSAERVGHSLQSRQQDGQEQTDTQHKQRKRRHRGADRPSAKLLESGISGIRKKPPSGASLKQEKNVCRHYAKE
jgi:non-canonical (house-cleaning) NTP pyrophosphatase